MPGDTKRDPHAVLGLVVGPVKELATGLDRREAGQGGTDAFPERDAAHLATPVVHRQLRALNVGGLHVQGFTDAQARMSAQEQQRGQPDVAVRQHFVNLAHIRRILDDARRGVRGT